MGSVVLQYGHCSSDTALGAGWAGAKRAGRARGRCRQLGAWARGEAGVRAREAGGSRLARRLAGTQAGS